ncbi:helix-turn-helix domain-containing protein [Psychroflexus sp. CAK57W]|uniref:helix-turn-helix domain-containing protein n=1 Tax=Psychroflexus curvus TaxID=2873595 RepID=UPI001CCF05D5|nr:helix-turn-helix domain-containing protein [Psychroflexus curvus]MBZ9787607.1 helix-turn-helix domain-containing protein [Psychroflexus curvus]
MSKPNDVHLIQVTLEQLENVIDNKFNRNLENLSKILQTKDADDELLTREQTAKFLQVDVSTLYLWVKKKKIKAYGIGNRRYFKRSELIESLTPIENK